MEQAYPDIPLLYLIYLRRTILNSLHSLCDMPNYVSVFYMSKI